MTNINLLITGPIRPNIDYVNYIINYFKDLINHNVVVFLCYWEKEEIDKALIKNVDYLFNENEPEDKEIFGRITSRTIQQRQLPVQLEDWTPRIYKMFYGIRQLVKNIDNGSLLSNDDIVLRIRTDLHVEGCNFEVFNNLLNDVEENTVYNRLRGTDACDWFSISTYDTFKKIWYIENDDGYNDTIKHLFNAESIIFHKSRLNEINIVDIHSIIELCICRGYDDKSPILERYG